jgi:hypothetical protein
LTNKVIGQCLAREEQEYQYQCPALDHVLDTRRLSQIAWIELRPVLERLQ